MGQAKIKREAFLKKNPFCIFCGGSVAATTIEHCPPRAMFQNRQWPEGFEFPACDRCNGGTRNHDLIVSMLSRIDPISDSGNRDGRLTGLFHRVNDQYPGLFEKMMPSPVEARRNNREYGFSPKNGETHQEVSRMVKVTPEIHDAVCVFASKLSKGIYYLMTNKIFSADGCLLLNWFTNADFFRNGKYIPIDLLKHVTGDVPPVIRSGKYLNDQFQYKISLSSEQHIFVLQVIFGSAFGLVVFGSTISGILESNVERLREENGNQGPFAILQSRIL